MSAITAPRPPGSGIGAAPAAGRGIPWRRLVVAVVAIGLAGVLGLVGGQEPVIALLLATAAGLGLAIVIRPHLATIVAIGAIYLNVPVVMVRFHGLPEFTAIAVILLLAVPLAEDLIVGRAPVVITRAFPWVVLFLLSHLVSTLLARSTGEAFPGLITFLQEGVLLYLLVTNAVRTRQQLLAATWVIVLAGAVMGGLSLHQQLTQNYGDAYFGFAQPAEATVGNDAQGIAGERGQPRLTGPIGEENRYGQVLLVLVPLGIALAIGARTVPNAVAVLGLTGLVLMGVILTFSRGAAVTVAGIMLLGVLLRLIPPRFVGLGIVAAIAAFAFVPGYLTRIVTIEELLAFITPDATTSGVGGSFLSRATEAGAALLTFADHPVFGVGPGMFGQYYREYAHEIGLRVLAADRAAHNFYLGLAAEYGLFGIFALGGVILVTVRELFRARRRAAARHRDLALLATGYICAIAGYLGSGMFLHMAFIRYLWVLLALAGAAGFIICRLVDDEEAEEADAVRAAGPAAAERAVRNPGARTASP